MVLKASDSPCKDVILKALTRLNEKSTSRAAAEELSIIVRALDQDSLSALVQSICSTTGAWEPKPVAKKEGVRVLAQLPLQTCPVADVALQQLLPRILGYLKKTLQDTDGLVREASSEALAAYALGATRLCGCELPGTTASPVVKVVFDSLAEQKKEAQMGASQALLKMSPYLGPLDKDLVKVILKLLRSPSFLGTAQLLAAIASTDAEQKAPMGLLKHGTAAFLPFINHLIGQPQQQRRGSAHSNHEAAGASSGGGSSASFTMTASSKPLSASGILGCLSSPDWAVRRAAADAVRAVVLLVGPGLEPEECWGIGDPGSVTGRCLNALEDCRFDKVKEAREATREAAALIHQLHQFVSEQGSDGDWPAWASSNLPYSGLESPACSPPRSPMAGRSNSSFRPLSSRQPMSPIAARFRSAAVDTDVIVEPSSRVTQDDEAHEEDCDPALCDSAAEAAGSGMLHPGEDGCVADEAMLAGREGSSSDLLGDRQHSSDGPDGDLAAEHSIMSVSSSQRGSTGRALSKQTSQKSQPRMQASSSGGGGPAGPSRTSRTSGSRPGSAHASRPASAAGSIASSRTSTHDQQAPLGRESSSGAVSGAVPSYAAGTRSSAARGPTTQQAAGSRGASRCPVPGTSKARGAIAKQQPAVAWQGPTQQEWEQQQQQLLEQQHLVSDLQQQLAGMRLQHSQEQQGLKDANFAMQERLAALEVQVQQQQQVIQEQQHLQDMRQRRSISIPAAPRSPVRSSSNPSTGSSMAAAAAFAISSPVAALPVNSPRTALALSSPPAASAMNSPATALANSPVAGVVRSPGRDVHQQRPGALSEGPASSSRLYKSAEWGSPHGCGSPVKAFVSPIDPMGAGRHSLNSLMTPTSANGGLKGCDSTVATPGDLEAAYAEAVRGAKGSVHLLRLTQKTGPVWGQLSEHTCQALLEVFIKNVRDGVMLHRVLPWLWRLADEDAGRPHVPEGLQQQLLEALDTCPAAEDMQAQERVCLLLDTLKSVWSVK